MSLFRHLSLTCLTNLEDVEQLLHHLAQLAPPTHYVALQVNFIKIQQEVDLPFRPRSLLSPLFPTQTTLMKTC